LNTFNSPRRVRVTREFFGNKILNTVKAILDRYKEYGGFLSFPYEWGERAFRGWLVCEVFHETLGWPFSKIIFGEQFDVLFINENIKPKIYLETKKPGRGLAEFEQFQERIKFYGTIRYAVITDGFEWARYELISKNLINPKFVDTKKSSKAWGEFFFPLQASMFFYRMV